MKAKINSIKDISPILWMGVRKCGKVSMFSKMSSVVYYQMHEYCEVQPE